MGYQVTALKKLSKKKKPVGRGKGHSDLPVSVEPEAFDDIPMNPSAGCTALAEITAGHVRNAPNTPMLHIVPRNLGRLQQQLQQLLENTSTDRTQTRLQSGSLSGDWVGVVSGNESVFKRRKIEEGIDSAVLIAVDQSSSMGGACMVAAAHATLQFSEALKRCNGVEFEVRGFSDAGATVVTQHGVDGAQNGLLSRAAWRMYKSFKESANVLRQRGEWLYHASGCTPEIAALNDALIALSKRPEPRKVLIWIGDGDGYRADAIKALQAKHKNIKVIGIGIGVDLSAYFTHNVKIKTIADLGTASFGAVIKALKK